MSGDEFNRNSMDAVLARMEDIGVRVDPDQLRAMSGRMDQEIGRLSAEIYEIAGRTFNINSPQQLGKVLFEDLGIASGGKTKGKQLSTAADVLEGLAADYPICAASPRSAATSSAMTSSRRR